MFTLLTRYRRITHIIGILLHYKIDTLLLPSYVFAPLRAIIRLNPRYRAFSKADNPPEQLRLALEALGPIFVKFGQILSTRHDLLPAPMTKELTKLQDKVKPFSSKTVCDKLESTYGQPMAELFKTFDMTPLASASIAQVHKATRHDGRNVAVKILRPNIKKTIQQDLDLFYTAARWLERLWPGSHRLHPKAVVAEFERCLAEETNLLHEAANAAQLKRQSRAMQIVCIPDIHWDYARKDSLVMDFVQGISIADISTLKAHSINLNQLAKHIVELFFAHVFKHGYFHADMHPGNLFVDTQHPDFPVCLMVDFGIMGSLSPTDQRYLAQNLLAFLKQDYREVAILHIKSGWVPADTRVDVFESAIRAVCESLLAQPLSKLSMGQMLSQLLQTAQQFNMEVLPQLLLLQKTVLNVESLARSLDSDLDIWSSIKPFVQQWMKEQMGLPGVIKKVKHHLPFWLDTFPDIPNLLYETLSYQSSQAKLPAKPATPQTQKSTTPRWAFLKGLMLGLFIAVLISLMVS